jgi:hypothetical protein
VDEAYTYNKDDQYENIILTEFLQELTRLTTCEDRIIFIFAGYPDQMKEWGGFNPGFEGRIKQKFRIPPLSPSSLTTIMLEKLNKTGFVVDADPTVYASALTKMIKQGTTHEQRTEHGGRVAEMLVERVHATHVDTDPVKPHVVTQETVCKAIKRLGPDQFGQLKVDIGCILVDRHPSLPAAHTSEAKPTSVTLNPAPATPTPSSQPTPAPPDGEHQPTPPDANPDNTQDNENVAAAFAEEEEACAEPDLATKEETDTSTEPGTSTSSDTSAGFYTNLMDLYAYTSQWISEAIAWYTVRSSVFNRN